MRETEMTQFPKVSKEQWLDKVKADLKGKPLDGLNWKLDETFEISPFKDPSDIDQDSISSAQRANNLWHTVEPIRVSSDFQSDNTLILDALQKGASGLSLYFEVVPTIDQLNLLLGRVFLNLIPVELVFTNRDDFTAAVTVFRSFVHQTAFNSDEIEVYFSVQNTIEQRKSYPSAQLISDINSTLLNSKLMTINGTDFYSGHTKVVNELGSILHTIQYVLNHYQNKNIALRQIIKNINVECVLDDSYYINIAKIRALRRCTDLIYNAYGINHNEELNIKIKISPPPTPENANFHRIRVASIAMSAVIAGVNRLELFDINSENSGEDIEFQRRIARNVSHLMQLESYMDRVNDPAAGSYYLESLTEEIAHRAWTDFQNKWSKTQE